MLTGQPPDSAPDRMIYDTLTEIVQQEPGLSPGVKQWIIRSTQVKSSDRPQNVTEFGAGIRKCQSDTTQPKPVTQDQQPVPRQENVSEKEGGISQPVNDIRYNSKREQNVPEKEDVPSDKVNSDGEQKPDIPVWRKKGWIALGVCLLIVASYLINVATQKKAERDKKITSVVLDRPVDSALGSNSAEVKKDAWTDPATDMEFVWVPGAGAQMGCGSWTSDCGSDESPVHEVCVDGFWLGKTEVTQGQWVKVMGSNPSNFQKGDNYPVEQVSWKDAKEYIRKLNGLGSAKFRLPSEAEWEYAARSGGKPEKYSGANDVDAVAWYESNSGNSTHPVKTKKANGLGLYDMSGNVWEWCEDVYIRDIYSKSANSKNPIYTSGGTERVIRGGGWNFLPDSVRCAVRYCGGPAGWSGSVGFRLLRMP
jgi:formylglycine-generating enzyme required for sulfatase activity